MPSELNAECETSGNVKLTKNEIDGPSDSYASEEKENHKAKEVERLSDQVFSIQLVLKEILKYLGISDLLRTSLINKYWNFFSREVLRESKKCLVNFAHGDVCQNLTELNSVLLNTDCETIPFNGVSLTGPWEEYHHCELDEDLSELIENFFGKINIKYLNIDFQGARGEAILVRCLCKFIQKIVLKNATSVEEIRFDNAQNLNCVLSEIVRVDPVDSWLPNLRILEIPFDLKTTDMHFSLFEDLVGASRKLQKLYSRIDTEWLECILQLNLAQAVKEFYFMPIIQTLRNSLDFAMKNPKLEKLWFTTFLENPNGWYEEADYTDWEQSFVNDVATILIQLLNSSKESLRKVAFGHLELFIASHQWNMPVLEKVTHLRILNHLEVDEDDIEGYCPLRKIDCAKFFPNLKEVSMTFESPFNFDGENGYCIIRAARESTAHFVCETVTKVSWKWCHETQIIEMFKQIFPNVKEFYLRRCERLEDILKELWTGWTELEAIYTSVVFGPWHNNYDSTFLGISETEAAYLSENVEDFKTLEIVPTAPSIYNLPRLKKMVIHLLYYNNPGPVRNPDSFFLSRLTGQCALARLPALEVEVYSELSGSNDCNLNIFHMEPFITFVEWHNLDDFGVSFEDFKYQRV